MLASETGHFYFTFTLPNYTNADRPNLDLCPQISLRFTPISLHAPTGGVIGIGPIAAFVTLAGLTTAIFFGMANSEPPMITSYMDA